MTPPCTLHITTEMLSGWHDDMLMPPETRLLNDHIPTCAACQMRVQHFRDIHDILARQPQLQSNSRIRDALRRRIWQRDAPALLRSRSIMNGIGAGVLLVLVVTLFFVLLGKHQPGISPPVPTATGGHATALPTITATTTASPTPTGTLPTATPPTGSPTAPAPTAAPPTGIAGIWESLQPGNANTASYCYLLTITSTPSATIITARLSTAQPTCASAVIGGFPMSGTFDGTTLNLHEVAGASALADIAPLAFVRPAHLQANCGDTTYYAFYSASPQSLVGDLTVCTVATPVTFTRVG